MPAYGRGGAGNISVADEATRRAAADLEANHVAVVVATEDMLPVTGSTSTAQTWKHVGRGGVGNLYNPVEGETALAAAAATAAAMQNERPTRNGEDVSARSHGRGGAGNLSVGMGQAERIKLEEEENGRKETMSRQIEKEVDEHLAVPAKAKMAGSPRR